jgi:hypothetical protein
LAELFLGLLLLAPLLGDTLLKLFQPILEQTNLGGGVSATAQLGWKAAKALKAITATAIFLSRLLARIFMALHPSALWMRGMASRRL